MAINFSFEFFPPRTEKGEENLKITRQKLEKYNPEFYSVTFGAGGSTRDKTFETIQSINSDKTVSACPHISCIGSEKTSITELLESYQNIGVNRLVALRGDIPSGMMAAGELNYGSELVSFIRETTGDHFTIAAAAYPEMHPQAKNLLADFHQFKHKMDCGADMAITQYFYNIEGFLRFRDLCIQHHINQPLIPGIMPIANIDNLIRFSENCGADIPRWLRKTLSSWTDPQDQKKCAQEIVLNLCQKLVNEDVNDLHFYTMNQHVMVAELIEGLN